MSLLALMVSPPKLLVSLMLRRREGEEMMLCGIWKKRKS
jgi:hypothetical protein